MTKEQIIRETLKEQKIVRYQQTFTKCMDAAMTKYLEQELTAEREKWEAEKKEILSAVARGERLSEELRIDGPSLLEQEREKAAKLVEALENCIGVIRELDGTSYVAYTGAKVAISDYKQSLTEYKKQ